MSLTCGGITTGGAIGTTPPCEPPVTISAGGGTGTGVVISTAGSANAKPDEGIARPTVIVITAKLRMSECITLFTSILSHRGKELAAIKALLDPCLHLGGILIICIFVLLIYEIFNK
jgi:hypothetical protein